MMSTLRCAQPSDIPILQDLIARSGRELSVGYYTEVQTEAVTRYVFGVDTQLVADQTYFLIEDEGNLCACGGWSKRRTLFGGDQVKQGPDPLLDPATDAARIRAFFVDPSRARRGFGRQLMDECIAQSRAAGFHALELASTLPGEPFYLALGFHPLEHFGLDLPGDVYIPLIRMRLEI